jgi:hypothetical protein
MDLLGFLAAGGAGSIEGNTSTAGMLRAMPNRAQSTQAPTPRTTRPCTWIGAMLTHTARERANNYAGQSGEGQSLLLRAPTMQRQTNGTERAVLGERLRTPTATRTKRARVTA